MTVQQQYPTTEQITAARVDAQALAQQVIDLMDDDDVTERVQADLAGIERVLDLFPQPTPSAEPRPPSEYAMRSISQDAHHADCDHVDDQTMPCNCRVGFLARRGVAELVSIAAMPPGTTFTADRAERFTIWDNLHGVRLVLDSAGRVGALPDPSTIRDVTPPPATTGESDHG